jgi:hypothetical protein
MPWFPKMVATMNPITEIKAESDLSEDPLRGRATAGISCPPGQPEMGVEFTASRKVAKGYIALLAELLGPARSVGAWRRRARKPVKAVQLLPDGARLLRRTTIDSALTWLALLAAFPSLRGRPWARN